MREEKQAGTPADHRGCASSRYAAVVYGHDDAAIIDTGTECHVGRRAFVSTGSLHMAGTEAPTATRDLAPHASPRGLCPDAHVVGTTPIGSPCR